MKIAKILLVFGYGLFLVLAATNNALGAQGTYGAVAMAVQMKTTFQEEIVMWRAIENPTLIWMAVFGIVLTEAVAGVLAIFGAVKLWSARKDSAAFNSSKKPALQGLAIAACFYLIAFGTVCNEWFMLWQNRQSQNLNEAFRDFVTAMLIIFWLEKTDD